MKIRYLLNRSFVTKLKKELKHEKVDKAKYSKQLFENFHKHKKDNLGAKLYKVRVAKEGKGKSGGFRNIVFWENDKWAIAVYIFSKGDKENLTKEEFKYLKILSQQYEKFTEEIINNAVKKNIFEEIHYEPEKR
ncbi:MAG: type II toxin-antitoxin system RelE/ParE family toxin [Candidatus Omnitrophica bacterium]|nr:type II toxin-antitoxin system RelE/ParE family toxin [Candidatus Omnitrophota bacterium]